MGLVLGCDLVYSHRTLPALASACGALAALPSSPAVLLVIDPDCVPGVRKLVAALLVHLQDALPDVYTLSQHSWPPGINPPSALVVWGSSKSGCKASAQGSCGSLASAAGSGQGGADGSCAAP